MRALSLCVLAVLLAAVCGKPQSKQAVQPGPVPPLAVVKQEVIGTLTCGSEVNGSTVGATNTLEQDSGDNLYVLIIDDDSGTQRISTCGANFDSYLHVFDTNMTKLTSCDDCNYMCDMCAPCYDCNTCNLQSSMETHLAVGTYYLVVEGYSDLEGEYHLSIDCNYTPEGSSPPPEETSPLPEESPMPECRVVTFTTRTTYHAESAGPIFVEGFGTLPSECSQGPGSWCTVTVCADALVVVAGSSDGWVFNVEVEGRLLSSEADCVDDPATDSLSAERPCLPSRTYQWDSPRECVDREFSLAERFATCEDFAEFCDDERVRELCPNTCLPPDDDTYVAFLAFLVGQFGVRSCADAAPFCDDASYGFAVRRHCPRTCMC